MTPEQYISGQRPDRIGLLSEIHSIILQEDKMVDAAVGLMMGKEMILYKENNRYFKYGLSSVKQYISLHLMPIYGGSPLHARYRKLLPQAQFQKGCINFVSAADVPPDILHQLFADCARVNITAMLENRNRRR
jgi:hypothetical protein